MTEFVTTILFSLSGLLLTPFLLAPISFEEHQFSGSYNISFPQNSAIQTTTQKDNLKPRKTNRQQNKEKNNTFPTSATSDVRIEQEKKQQTSSYNNTTTNDTEEIITSSSKQASSTKTVEKEKSQLDKKEQKNKKRRVIKYNVPFTPQAPTANWSDSRQQQGCEEASALMAIKWAKGENISSLNQAEQDIIDITNFAQKKYGEHRDLSAFDTTRLIKDYFQYENVSLEYDISIEDIIGELRKGRLVALHVNGRVLDNPYYTPPGPKEHVIVITGFNQNKKKFITHDPGTKRGENFRYKFDTIKQALRDYNTGLDEPMTEERKAMISVSK